MNQLNVSLQHSITTLAANRWQEQFGYVYDAAGNLN